jgi:hypothetical protein
MTSWGALLLGGFLFLGFRRSVPRAQKALIVVSMTAVVLLLVAVRQHTP